MRSSGNDHVLIEEGVWNGASTGVFFIHLGGLFNAVEAELLRPGLMLPVHQ